MDRTEVGVCAAGRGHGGQEGPLAGVVKSVSPKVLLPVHVTLCGSDPFQVHVTMAPDETWMSSGVKKLSRTETGVVTTGPPPPPFPLRPTVGESLPPQAVASTARSAVHRQVDLRELKRIIVNL